MVERSLSATSEGIEQINRALTEKEWSREDLAKAAECSRQPAVKFCSGKTVSKKLFVSFCKLLDLDWEAIAGLAPIVPDHSPQLKTENSKLKTPSPQHSPTPRPDIDTLVQQIRQQVHADIHHRCGTMRVLDMEQPIGIGDIYTSVNILEKLSGRRRLALADLWQDCDLENFDRFHLGRVTQKRVPGLEAVDRYDELMILGKPGAGKTTFMKRLATLCNQGEFLADHVPVFVTLKEFAEAEGKPSLRTYIGEQCYPRTRQENAESVVQTLMAGQVLVLLDGLDEVLETEHGRVLQAIKEATQTFRSCHFVITCRIAAREYTFEQFTEVEMADFNPEQIAEFATKWFKAKDDPQKSKTFIQRLENNEPIQELATNPLLLTLLCLVFGDAADFPSNRAELYKEGLDILLKKWDAKRNIERDQVYKKLSLKRKEDLLSQLAFKTFECGDYFFKQGVVEQHIVEYIRNLPGASEDEEVLLLDSEAVLKSIEAQHGLLVERARHIYSFSHLACHEYFVAKQITSPTAKLSQSLENFVTHVTEKRYREVLFLVLEMLPEADADSFLKLIKQQVDQLLVNDPKLQEILAWVLAKAQSVRTHYKQSAVRAFYFNLDLARDLRLDLDILFGLNRDLPHDLGLKHTPNLAHDLALDNTLNLARDKALRLGRNYSHIVNSSTWKENALDFIRDRTLAKAHDLTQILTRAASKGRTSNSELKFKIKSLETKLPSLDSSNQFLQWWQEYGQEWIADLRAVMVGYRNIGHDWQLTEAQRSKLRQYYDANSLLVECLNSDCYVTKATRREIEETLLLPMVEIEQRKESS
ncbi:MAG: NACHT domain-containing NTPase [Leptolyngbyaceae cyanobacterium]